MPIKPSLEKPYWLCGYCNNAVCVDPDRNGFVCCGGDTQSILLFEEDAFNLFKTVNKRAKEQRANV
jgi:hypothetical protein